MKILFFQKQVIEMHTYDPLASEQYYWTPIVSALVVHIAIHCKVCHCTAPIYPFLFPSITRLKVILDVVLSLKSLLHKTPKVHFAVN